MNPYYRYVFWPLWFVLVPLALAWATVWLAVPSGDLYPDTLVEHVRFWVQDQKVPALIVFFTIFEMVLYHFRHSLPLAGKVGVGGRTDLPRDARRAYERGGHLIDEAHRILRRHEERIKAKVPAEAREEIAQSLDRLRDTMSTQHFDQADFEARYEKAATLVAKHLSQWRKSELREYAESILIAVLVALLLRAFVVEAFKIPSGSMLPTLQIQDHIFVNKFIYGPLVPYTKSRLWNSLPPERGDVIVFEYPDPNPRSEPQDFIKRVVALPGDELRVENGHPIINGWKVPACRVGENYHFEAGDEFNDRTGELFVEYLGEYAYLTVFEDDRREGSQGPYYVKEGEVWVLGDNRNNSSDSRAWYGGKGGGAPFANIKGRAMFVWMSFTKGGSPTIDRLFFNVMGRPQLPEGAPPELTENIARCLRNPPSETFPPPPKPSARTASP